LRFEFAADRGPHVRFSERLYVTKANT
jgi:hypothetical protein